MISTPLDSLKDYSQKQGTLIAKDLDHFVLIIQQLSKEQLEDIGLKGLGFFDLLYSSTTTINKVKSLL